MAAASVKSARIAPPSVRLRAESVMAPAPSTPIESFAAGAKRVMTDGSSPRTSMVPSSASAAGSSNDAGIAANRWTTRVSAPSMRAARSSDPGAPAAGSAKFAPSPRTVATDLPPDTSRSPTTSTRPRASSDWSAPRPSAGRYANAGTDTFAVEPPRAIDTEPFVTRSTRPPSSATLASSAPPVTDFAARSTLPESDA